MLSRYSGAALIDADFNDGDSFMVDIGGQVIHLRLYYADCPEKHVGQAHDLRRLQEQAGYFGIQNPALVKTYGEAAADFTHEVLARPFTVYTAHAKALGGRNSQRIYGFVVTADGRDLADLLVEKGLARNFGVRRQDYKQEPVHTVENRMHDLESAAMLARKGIWEHSNPELIVKYRELQRQEKAQLNLLMASAVDQLEDPVDINSADQRTLEKLPGIGPVTASRIIESRPYQSLNDLRRVRGVSDKLFNQILPLIKIEMIRPVNG